MEARKTLADERIRLAEAEANLRRDEDAWKNAEGDADATQEERVAKQDSFDKRDDALKAKRKQLDEEEKRIADTEAAIPEREEEIRAAQAAEEAAALIEERERKEMEEAARKLDAGEEVTTLVGGCSNPAYVMREHHKCVFRNGTWVEVFDEASFNRALYLRYCAVMRLAPGAICVIRDGAPVVISLDEALEPVAPVQPIVNGCAAVEISPGYICRERGGEIEIVPVFEISDNTPPLLNACASVYVAPGYECVPGGRFGFTIQRIDRLEAIDVMGDNWNPTNSQRFKDPCDPSLDQSAMLRWAMKIAGQGQPHGASRPVPEMLDALQTLRDYRSSITP
ncbi:hypothetical protein [Aliiroseovarius sp.]|uniref:hypothetical protein n=1 Tax=Aliiroseovarius sp. TaxID=1872442 RepID=UPI003BAD2028